MRVRRQQQQSVLVERVESRVLMSASAPPVPAVEAIDGTGNNLGHLKWGSSGVDLQRLSPASYGDGVSTPAGANRPSARQISNAISAQSDDLVNDRFMSDMVYVFGQFLDHDIDLTPTGTTEKFSVAVPTGDPSFDPNSTGTKTIPLSRSVFDSATGTSKANPRQQINAVTSFIDGSQVYGSDATRAAALRTFSGGRMKTSAGNMLPLNTLGLANANDAHLVPDDQLFLAGDVRANENVELTALQTLFVREHNRLADRIAANNPKWTDEQVYQAARRVVIGELQAITYNEFLPALLGSGAIKPYQGYNPKVNPGIATEFSTAAFRFGHSMLDGEIGRVNDDGTEVGGEELALRDAFFNPTLFNVNLPNHEGDIDPYLKGASSGNAQEIDVHVVDDIRNFLFGPPGAGGLDLASLNIQRGRDHGLADYNSMRQAYGLARVTSFAQITSDKAVQASMKATYGDVNHVDAWVGGLAEDHVKGGSVGALFSRIIADQFTRLRDGDRFFYARTFSGRELQSIERTTLSGIIQQNTSLTTLQKNVFYYGQPTTKPVQPPGKQLPPPPPPPPPPPAHAGPSGPAKKDAKRPVWDA